MILFLVKKQNIKLWFLFLVMILTNFSAKSQQRQRINLNKQWIVKSLEENETVPNILAVDSDMLGESWYKGDMPKQVQEFILENEELPDPSIQDNAAQWVTVFKKEWVYFKQFNTPDFSNEINLCFDGLDTEVEIVLNGAKIAYCNNMFRRWKIPVSKHLKPKGENNILMLRFIPPQTVMDDFTKKYPGENIRPQKYLRKSSADFSSYLGTRPNFIKMGVFDDVYLDVLPTNYFNEIYITSKLALPYEKAVLNIAPNLQKISDSRIKYEIFSPGNVLITENLVDAKELIQVKVDKPELWWPLNYGKQALYTIKLSLYSGSKLLDVSQTKFGIRDLELIQNDEKTGAPLFGFKINGKMIFMNGANWAPLTGFTHVWDEQKANQLFDLMKLGNMNFLRMWGEGSMPGKSFFEKCNEYGIVVWMEFMSSAPLEQPLFDEGFVSNFKAEIEDEIKRFRNYSCIALWCGGNEHYLKFKSKDGDNTKPLGRELFQEIMPQLVDEFDPERYFHPSSPWANDEDWINGNNPLKGDYHDYSTFRFQPNNTVPLFTTEVCMVSPYSLYNLSHFMSEDEIWPENFKFIVDKPGKKAWPPGWEKHTLGSSWSKIGRIQNYCDITNAADACRVFGTAHGEYLKERYERQRRGVPDSKDDGNRKSWGAAIWRLNDTWPMMYMSAVDYYLEPKIPYYFLKRACEPLLVSFEQTEDQISVWVTNDTPYNVSDSLIVELWSFSGQRKKRVAVNAEVSSENSKRIINLTHEFYEVWKRKEFLVARYKGEVVSHLLWPEKFLELNDAIIHAEKRDDELIIWSDSFVKDVQIEFLKTTGEIFSDNYFNLLPNEKRSIRIVNDAGGNVIHIKGVNSKTITIQ